MSLAPWDRYIQEANALTPDNPFDVHSIARFLAFPIELVDVLVRIP